MCDFPFQSGTLYVVTLWLSALDAALKYIQLLLLLYCIFNYYYYYITIL